MITFYLVCVSCVTDHIQHTIMLDPNMIILFKQITSIFMTLIVAFVQFYTFLYLSNFTPMISRIFVTNHFLNYNRKFKGTLFFQQITNIKYFVIIIIINN